MKENTDSANTIWVLTTNVCARLIYLKKWKSIFPVKSNLWTNLSFWEDFNENLSIGSKPAIHIVVARFKRELEYLEEADAYIGTLDENEGGKCSCPI